LNYLRNIFFLGEAEDNNAVDEEEILVDGVSRPRNSEGLIKLRQFATVPHLPRNVQSRGSTPSTTPAPSGSSSSAAAATLHAAAA
jgi:hypothetical protein